MKCANKSYGNKTGEAYAMSNIVMRYSGMYIFSADWILRNVQTAKMSGLGEILRKIQILKKFRLEHCKKIWTPNFRNLEFEKYFAELRFSSSRQGNLRSRITIQWRNITIME